MKILQRNWAVLLLILVLCSCNATKLEPKETVTTAPQQTRVKNWQDSLKSSFRMYYSKAVESHAKKMHASYPVITQDLLNMTLILTNGEKVRYQMNKDGYFTLAHTTHPPLTLYSILYPKNFKIDSDVQMALANYRKTLESAIVGVQKVNHINETQKQRITSLLRNSLQYVKIMLVNLETSKEEYHEYAKSVKPFIEGNLHDGAKEQLDQFLGQINIWKKEYPNENWNELRVAVLGFHQARDLYALKLLFQWLLKEPKYEDKVVYAEFQFSIFGSNRENAEQKALELLTKVDLEKEPSYLILGDKTLLQKDVMGPAAKKILESWSKTD